MKRSTPKVRTLLFSKLADKRFGHNVMALESGRRVKYTGMTNESVHGAWRNDYLWKDAKVVGHIGAHYNIVEYSKVKPERKIKRIDFR